MAQVTPYSETPEQEHTVAYERSRSWRPVDASRVISCRKDFNELQQDIPKFDPVAYTLDGPNGKVYIRGMHGPGERLHGHVYTVETPTRVYVLSGLGLLSYFSITGDEYQNLGASFTEFWLKETHNSTLHQAGRNGNDPINMWYWMDYFLMVNESLYKNKNPTNPAVWPEAHALARQLLPRTRLLESRGTNFLLYCRIAEDQGGDPIYRVMQYDQRNKVETQVKTYTYLGGEVITR